MTCEWPCVDGCCGLLENARDEAVRWRALVKAGKKQEAQAVLRSLLEGLAQEGEDAGRAPGRVRDERQD